MTWASTVKDVDKQLSGLIYSLDDSHTIAAGLEVLLRQNLFGGSYPPYAQGTLLNKASEKIS